MAHVSSNPTWQDYPSVATLITAAGLENIESVLDLLYPLYSGPHARYHCNVSGGQNITANGAPQNIPFDVALDTHADVTRNGTTTFTLNRAGVWQITAGVRMQTVVNAGHQFMVWNGSASAARYAETVTTAGSANSWNVTTTRRFAAGAVVAAGLAILTTGTNDKVATDVPESTFISLTWIRP